MQGNQRKQPQHSFCSQVLGSSRADLSSSGVADIICISTAFKSVGGALFRETAGTPVGGGGSANIAIGIDTGAGSPATESVLFTCFLFDLSWSRISVSLRATAGALVATGIDADAEFPATEGT